MFDIPVWKQYTLTLDESAQYFNISKETILKLVLENPNAHWYFKNGMYIQIKRKQFEQIIDELEII